MRQKWVLRVVLVAVLFAAGCVVTRAQTDLALSALAEWSQSTNANGTIQLPSVHMGGLAQLRHISNPLVGYEITYSYNRANQLYVSSGSAAVALPPQSVKANANQVTGDWVISLRLLNFKPFALGGVGVLVTRPLNDQSFTQTATTVVYVYGAGLDIGLIPHFGLRLQYRGNVNKAPDLSTVYTSTDQFVHTAEPMAGLYIRF